MSDLKVFYFSLLIFLLLSGCENESIEKTATSNRVESTSQITEKNLSTTLNNTTSQISENDNQQIQIENKHYLFDVTEHSFEELQDLLSRIAEVTEASPEAFDNLEIVMILHGPDIDYFTKHNYLQNKSIVDLAAKLDAFKTIDMKVCETAMEKLGFDSSELPDFIETVPFAPKTISSYQEQGYINL